MNDPAPGRFPAAGPSDEDSLHAVQPPAETGTEDRGAADPARGTREEDRPSGPGNGRVGDEHTGLGDGYEPV